MRPLPSERHRDPMQPPVIKSDHHADHAREPRSSLSRRADKLLPQVSVILSPTCCPGSSSSNHEKRADRPTAWRPPTQDKLLAPLAVILRDPGTQDAEHQLRTRWEGKLASVAQSCPTLCDPVDCSLPGSSVQGVSRQESWSG